MDVFGHFLAHLPSSRPFVYLGGRGSQRHIFSWDITLCDVQEVFSSTLLDLADRDDSLEDFPRYVGLLSYDDFSTPYLSYDLSYDLSYGSVASQSESLLFKLSSVLTLDHRGEFVWYGSPSKQSLEDFKTYRRRFPSHIGKSTSFAELTLVAEGSAADYKAQVRKVLADIRRGRYYQLNLLRYFRIPALSWCDLSQDSAVAQPWWRGLMARFSEFSDHMSALISWDRNLVASFSPERFVSIQRQKEGLLAKAFPIKGTIARDQDPLEDLKRKQELSSSRKDGAELAMIVDLMRHDLTSISKLGSTEVLDRGSIQELASVFHLVACVQSVLREDVRFSEILKALLPAGSITGAPKIEVMRAISEYEGRPRGYFMGSIYTLNSRGGWDSSVLIRTMTVSYGEEARYGAGSGIVVLSDPEKECEEIHHKCRIWGSSLTKAEMVGLS